MVTKESSKLGGWFVKGALLFFGALLLMVIGAFGYDVYALRRLPTDYPPSGQFVNVSGARMHYMCQGKGEPTLVLEAGIGGGTLDWTPVLSSLAEHHRVCAFDRLGQDWSDPAPMPRTFSTTADDLHSALQTLGINHPVIVGHSLGGAVAQIYAAKYDVAGVVLVEGLSSDMAEVVLARLGSYQSLNGLGQLGLLRPIGLMLAHPAYTPEVRAKMIALRSTSTALQSFAAEGYVAAQTAGKELRVAENNLNVPLLIIAAEKSDVPELPIGAFATALKALSERKRNSIYVLVPEAGHYVQADHSRDVVMAIESWLGSVK